MPNPIRLFLSTWQLVFRMNFTDDHQCVRVLLCCVEDTDEWWSIRKIDDNRANQCHRGLLPVDNNRIFSRLYKRPSSLSLTKSIERCVPGEWVLPANLNCTRNPKFVNFTVTLCTYDYFSLLFHDLSTKQNHSSDATANVMDWISFTLPEFLKENLSWHTITIFKNSIWPIEIRKISW